MNRKKLMLTMAGLMSLSVALTACGGSSDSGSTESSGEAPKDQSVSKVELIKAENPDKVPDVAKNRKDTLIIGVQDPKGILNPIYGGTAVDTEVCNTMFSSLLEVKEDGSLEEYLSEMPKVSEDGKVITFKIKDGMKWSDGQPIVSDDVELSYKIIADKTYTGEADLTDLKIKGYDDFREGKAKDISGIKKIDKQTIEITVEKPRSTTVRDLAIAPLPNHYYGKVYNQGDTSKVEGLHRDPKVCSGPYKFVSYRAGEQVVLEANDNFFKGKPKIKNLIFKTVTDKTSMAQLQAGEVDTINPTLNPETAEQIKETGFADTLYYPYNGYGYIGMNMFGNSKFKDVKVRQAMMYAVDRQRVIDSVYGEYATMIHTPIAKVSWAYPKDSKLEEYKYDLDKAAKLLEEAGWKKNSSGMLEKDGEVFKLRFLQSTGNEVNDALIPVLKDSMKTLGVDFVPEQLDFNTISQKIKDAKDESAYDMYFMAWQLNAEPDASSIFKTGGQQNRTGYSNPKVDELQKKELEEVDQEKRKPIFKDLYEELNKDVPFLYIYQRMNCYVVNSRVKNFKDTNYVRYYRYLQDMTLE